MSKCSREEVLRIALNHTSWLRKWLVRRGIPKFIGYFKLRGFVRPHPFYLLYCPRHGYYVDYPHGYTGYFHCLKCINEAFTESAGERLRLSGAMPVHNEEKYLPYGLASLTDAPLDELCIVLDRCSDRSERIIKSWIRRCKPKYEVVLYNKQDSNWHNKRAEAFQKAFELCSGDVIYSLAPDCIYPKQIFNWKLFLHYDFVAFYYRPYDLQKPTVYSAYSHILTRIRGFKNHPLPFRMGVYGVKKELWEKIGGFRDTEQHGYIEEHDLILRLQKAKAKMHFIKNANVLHLRHFKPGKWYREGQFRARFGMGFLKTLIHSIVLFAPECIIGFLHAKRKS